MDAVGLESPLSQLCQRVFLRIGRAVNDDDDSPSTRCYLGSDICKEIRVARDRQVHVKAKTRHRRNWNISQWWQHDHFFDLFGKQVTKHIQCNPIALVIDVASCSKTEASPRLHVQRGSIQVLLRRGHPLCHPRT